MFWKMMNLQLELLIVLIIGFVIKKRKIITSEQQKGLSEILINVILPATIIKSFLFNETVLKDVFTDGLIMILICLSIQVILLIVSPFILKRFEKDKSHVMEYGLLVSNSAFIGIPVIEYIYGSQAVMYASIYLIPMRFTMWTLGLSLFTGSVDLKSSIKKTLRHPCIVSVFIGLLIMVFNIKFPLAITDTISLISKSSNCISMLAIGAILADCDWHNLFDFPTVVFTLLRLIVLPLTVYFVLKSLNIDSLLISISVLLTAMPCGCTCAILAQKYNYDYKFAAKLVLVTSLLSVITIPCICLLFG
ncbi:MAG: AEC family transporter [Erysipelotrichia bacterium]|nr:AEC family transporter [Erysipelotrichia bacterium]